MNSTAWFITSAVIIASLLTGCSNYMRKTGENKYIVNHKSSKSQEDARSQAVFRATLECTGQGKEVNILNENKSSKEGYTHNITFECVEYMKN